MIVTLFRTRMNPGVEAEYGPMAARMSELARAVPGYVSHKTFTAEDGERLTVVEFATEEAHQAWRVDPEHAKAKRRGIEAFYAEYKVQVCSLIRERAWAGKRRAPAG